MSRRCGVALTARKTTCDHDLILKGSVLWHCSILWGVWPAHAATRADGGNQTPRGALPAATAAAMPRMGSAQSGSMRAPPNTRPKPVCMGEIDMALTVDFLEIPADTSISEGLQCLSGRIVRIGMPDDWTPAPLTFRVSPNGVNYFDLYHTQVTPGAFTPFEVIVPSVIPASMLSSRLTAASALGGSNFALAPGRRQSFRLQPATPHFCLSPMSDHPVRAGSSCVSANTRSRPRRVPRQPVAACGNCLHRVVRGKLAALAPAEYPYCSAPACR